MGLLLDAIKVCRQYKPKFGRGSKGEGLTLEQFQELYRGDPFYNWFGLDNPMMYAAHKAGGGMTSVYRQIGIGCEKLFRTVIKHSFALSDEDATWSYQVSSEIGRTRTLSLDARVPLNKISDKAKRNRFRKWMSESGNMLGVDENVLNSLSGVVFEVRQGYKSKDSKRQNADIANAAQAYIKGYLPCVVVLSGQIDGDILVRYRTEKWSVLIGSFKEEDPRVSTYAFMREVVGYDLRAFFERNSSTFRKEIDTTLQTLLAAE